MDCRIKDPLEMTPEERLDALAAYLSRVCESNPRRKGLDFQSERR